MGKGAMGEREALEDIRARIVDLVESGAAGAGGISLKEAAALCDVIYVDGRLSPSGMGAEATEAVELNRGKALIRTLGPRALLEIRKGSATRELLVIYRKTWFVQAFIDRFLRPGVSTFARVGLFSLFTPSDSLRRKACSFRQ